MSRPYLSVKNTLFVILPSLFAGALPIFGEERKANSKKLLQFRGAGSGESARDKKSLCRPSFPFQAREAWTFPSTPSAPLAWDTAPAALGMPGGRGGRKQYSPL